MTERSLRRLLRRLVLLSLPVPASVVGVACGGVAQTQSVEPAGGGGNGNQDVAPKIGGGGGAEPNDASGERGLEVDATDPCFGSYCPQGGPDFPCPAMVGRCTSCFVPVTDGFSAAADGGTLLPGTMCAPYCGNGTFWSICELGANDAGESRVICRTDCTGRRPAGLVFEPGASANDLGGYFAEMAHLEAASIQAFRNLECELTTHRAPRVLIQMAQRAARDERRHARITRALARQHGGAYRAPRIEKRQRRSLEEMAVENAIEGCVRETFGALLATHQAARAKDPVIRVAMTRIAHDETRHASLAWRVAGWLSSKLDRAARKRVTEAQRAAATELLGASHRSHPEMTRLGLPDAHQGAFLVAQLFDAMWR